MIDHRPHGAEGDRSGEIVDWEADTANSIPAPNATQRTQATSTVSSARYSAFHASFTDSSKLTMVCRNQRTRAEAMAILRDRFPHRQLKSLRTPGASEG